MKQLGLFAILSIALVVILILSGAFFVVNEAEQVIITQFGEPIGEPKTTPGIYFKTPLVQQAHFFDKRFLEWDGQPNQIPTKDKRFIWVDSYARWRIADPLLFYQRVTDERGAQTRLDDILDSEMRKLLASHELLEIVRTSNREVQKTNEPGAELLTDELVPIQYGRDKITRAIVEAAAPKTKSLGIELLDVRIKRIKFVEEVQQKIFERMISERKRIAEKFRSEGQGDSARTIGKKERELKRIRSEAYREAEEIKGKADAQASTIYASAYNKNDQSREFYRFLKTMETYQKTLGENDLAVLSTKSELFSFLNSPLGE